MVLGATVLRQKECIPPRLRCTDSPDRLIVSEQFFKCIFLFRNIFLVENSWSKLSEVFQ